MLIIKSLTISRLTVIMKSRQVISLTINKIMEKIRQILHITSEKFIEKFVFVKEFLIYCLIILEIFSLVKIHNKVMYSHMLTDYPVKMVEFMQKNKMDGKILNKFGLGSYLSYKLYPDNLIFMDGRYEEVYSPKLLKEIKNFAKQEGDKDILFGIAGNKCDLFTDEKVSEVLSAAGGCPPGTVRP